MSVTLRGTVVPSSTQLTQPQILVPVSGTVVGDLLIVSAGGYNAPPIMNSSGWTAIASSSGSSTYPDYLYTWYKIATASDISGGVSISVSQAQYAGIILASFYGHNPTNPIYTHYTISYSTAPVTANVTASTNMVVSFISQMSDGGGVPIFTTPSGYTNSKTFANTSYHSTAFYSNNTNPVSGSTSFTMTSNVPGGGNLHLIAITQGIVATATNLAPNNAALDNRASAGTISWTYNVTPGGSSASTIPGTSQIDYRLKGTSNAWTTVTTPTGVTSYTFAANTFTLGEEYEYKVRTSTSDASGTYGQDSAVAYFTAGTSIWNYSVPVTSATQSGVLINNAIYTSNFASNITGWESNGVFGTYVAATVSQSTTVGNGDSSSLKVTWPTGYSWADIRLSGLNINQLYFMSVDVYVPSGSPDVTLDALFCTPTLPPPVITTKDAWVTKTMVFKASATDNYIGVKMVSGQTGTSGQLMYIDNVIVSPAIPNTAGTYYIEARTADAVGFGPWSAQSPTFVVSPLSNVYIKSGGTFKLVKENVRRSGSFVQKGKVHVRRNGSFN